jgi:hypothetical protein
VLLWTKRGTVVGRSQVAGGAADREEGLSVCVMAADLKGSSVTLNILLPGGATATGMIPEDVPPETRKSLLDPAVMGPPIVWLASPDAAGIPW